MSEQSVVDFWRDAILSSGAYPEFAHLQASTVDDDEDES